MFIEQNPICANDGQPVTNEPLMAFWSSKMWLQNIPGFFFQGVLKFQGLHCIVPLLCTWLWLVNLHTCWCLCYWWCDSTCIIIIGTLYNMSVFWGACVCELEWVCVGGKPGWWDNGYGQSLLYLAVMDPFGSNLWFVVFLYLIVFWLSASWMWWWCW